MTLKHSRNLFAAAMTLWLGGCMVGPDYRRPPVNAPAHYQELPGWIRATPSADAPKGDWWTGFNDPLLNQLEPLVAVSNQTVRMDYANYQLALAEVQVARSGLFPTVGISGSTTRVRGAAGNATGAQMTNSAGSLEGDVSWAPDLWGAVRRTIEENKATAQASAAILANATLSEQTALAATVIELRVTDAYIDFMQQTVNAYQEYLRVVADQSNAGTVAPSNVIMARTQLEGARSSLIALGVARSQYAHAIAVLVGKNPEALYIPHSTQLPSLPVVPVGVPTTLLQRRPDIAVAERQMAAQNAVIGITMAAYYPSLSLSAADGFSQSPLGGLLHLGNQVWSLGANVGETVFAGGLRHGEVAAARAAYEATVANYRNTVLGAFQNVENDLSGLRILAQQSKVLDATVRDATEGATIAFNEYQAGTVDYTTAAVAQATTLGAQLSALNVRQQLLLDTVSLIGDLGGGWSSGELGESQQATGAH